MSNSTSVCVNSLRVHSTLFSKPVPVADPLRLQRIVSPSLISHLRVLIVFGVILILLALIFCFPFLWTRLPSMLFVLPNACYVLTAYQFAN